MITGQRAKSMTTDELQEALQGLPKMTMYGDTADDVRLKISELRAQISELEADILRLDYRGPDAASASVIKAELMERKVAELLHFDLFEEERQSEELHHL